MTASRFIAQSESHIPITSVPLESLKRFLKLRNWRLNDDRVGSLLVYGGPQDDSGRPIILTLPATAEFEDTPEMISKVLCVLAALERTSVRSICEVISNLGCDFLRQRIISPSNSASIPLKTADRLLGTLSDLIDYAACLEEDPQPFYERRRKIGKTFTEKCRFGQTFMGSFGISIQMPIPPSLNNNSEQTPFERRVMIRIARGLLSISRGLQEADVGILTQAYRQGFNADLFETMLEMAEVLDNHNMEFQFLWSPEFPSPAEVRMSTPLSFSSEAIKPLVESAAKSLRSSCESRETTIEGPIVQLRIDEGSNDEDAIEPGAIKSGRRIICIQWELEHNRFANIRVPLPLENYKQACDAHRDGKLVSIRGRPEKAGKFYYLTSPSAFSVLDRIS